MPTAKLTKRTVDTAHPMARTYLIRDTEVKGFVLVVTPYGGKSYAVDYRAGRGRRARKRRITIGKHGSPWTPDTARREALQLLAEIGKGFDPAGMRQAELHALTISELCDLYLAEGVSHKKPSTLKADRARITHHLKPLLGSMRLDSITTADVERLLSDVAKGKTATPSSGRPGSVPKGGRGAAGQCVALIGTILAFAMKRGLRSDNPAHGVKKPPVRKMERFLSEQEMARLATSLTAELETHHGDEYAVAAIKLLLLTGCRKGEILGLRWDQVDLDNRCLRLPDSKTGAKIVYLNAPAIAVLSALPPTTNSPYVIVGKRDNTPRSGIDKVWVRVKTRAELKEVRLHDLRHSFASIGAIGGLSLGILGALLGHKHATTTARYAHLSADPIRAANEAIGARIAAAMASEAAPSPAPSPLLSGKRFASGHN
jgi:integrase